MNSDIVIRRMTANDIEQVVKIEQECFTTPWSYNSFDESLSKPYAVFFVAIKSDSYNENIAGYIGIYHIGDECDITNVAVKGVYRKMGIAKKLLTSVNEYAQSHGVRSINLEVRESNTPALKLYELMQYENIGIRKNFYEKPMENAIIMVRHF